jgi:hypothetical protein
MLRWQVCLLLPCPHSLLSCRPACLPLSLCTPQQLTSLCICVADGRLRILLQYRIARKRALRNTMNKIAAHLGGHGRHPNRDRGKAAAASEPDLGGIEVAAGEDGSSRVEL